MANLNQLRQELDSIITQLNHYADAGDVAAAEPMFLRRQVLEFMIARRESQPAIAPSGEAAPEGAAQHVEALKRRRVRELSKEIETLEAALVSAESLRFAGVGSVAAVYVARQVSEADYERSRGATKDVLIALKLELINLTGRDESFLTSEIERLQADLPEDDPYPWSGAHRQIDALKGELKSVREWRASCDEEFLTREIARLEGEEAADQQYAADLAGQGGGNIYFNNTAERAAGASERQSARRPKLQLLRTELARLMEASS